ncbi:hypothetical protein O8H14_001389 [Neisseria gonorrhoeae]
MSKFPMVVQAVYEGLELHEMVFLRDELERRTGALKDGAMPSETKERDKPAPAVLSAAGAGAPGFDEIGGGAPRYDWAALCARAVSDVCRGGVPVFPGRAFFCGGARLFAGGRGGRGGGVLRLVRG